MKLVVATCQFPVSADLDRNCHHILQQLNQARDHGADIAHFCETTLSGYAGVDFPSYQGFDWPRLKEHTRTIMDQSRRRGIRILLGSSHPLSTGHKPHNSVYVINERGHIATRHDKMFCASDQKGKGGELEHYTPGDHFTVFNVKGVRCGILICHEYRYPELYRELKKRGVQAVFHSFHAGHMSPTQLRQMRSQVGKENHPLNHGTTLPEITMPAAMQHAAACNYLWISCCNTSARESLWPAFFVRPDGVVTHRLRKNTRGILIARIDTDKPFYDSTAAWRRRAMNGVYHSGKTVRDPRSQNLRKL